MIWLQFVILDHRRRRARPRARRAPPARRRRRCARSSGPIVVLAIAASHGSSSAWRDVEVLGELFVGRATTETVLELGERPLDAARPAAHRSRHPVELAEPVVHRTADARHGERLELHATLGIETFDGVDQAEHARADEVARVDARRQAGTHTTGDELDQRRVVDDQVLASGRVLAVQPPRPLHLEVGVFGNDAHALGWASR